MCQEMETSCSVLVVTNYRIEWIIEAPKLSAETECRNSICSVLVVTNRVEWTIEKPSAEIEHRNSSAETERRNWTPKLSAETWVPKLDLQCSSGNEWSWMNHRETEHGNWVLNWTRARKLSAEMIPWHSESKEKVRSKFDNESEHRERRHRQV